MQELDIGLSAQFLGGPAQDGMPGRIEVLEIAIKIDDANQIERQDEELLAIFLGLAFGAGQLPVEQRLANGLAQAGEPIFEEIVGGSQAHELDGSFFAQRAGDNDQRNLEFAPCSELSAWEASKPGTTPSARMTSMSGSRLAR